MPREWSNLARVVYGRTYSRRMTGGYRTPHSIDELNAAPLEKWGDTAERAIFGNTMRIAVSDAERERLRYYLHNRKGGPAGRGYWISGTGHHQTNGGAALCNCWYFSLDNWENFVTAMDLLMLGGGVGASVEHRFVSKLPRVRRDVTVIHKPTRDADFIVPDSREGWNELLRRTLESFFVTGRSFSYSTVCIRGYGSPILGFGGTASGPQPLIEFITKLCGILVAREGKAVRPIDAADILCAIGEMVVAGNVRRSAILVLGDPWDREYLRAKRWDLGAIPTQRACANFSVAVDDYEDLTPAYWKTYEAGEPFGLFHRSNVRKFGRMGELKPDTAVGCNPCGEATLESGEPCNVPEIALPNLADADEFEEIARLLFRWGKRVTCEPYHHPDIAAVVARNRRIGVSITGCLQAPHLFNAKTLDRVYAALEEEDRRYSAELGVPMSIRRTTIKPSGTMSKVYDLDAEGIHGGWSRHYIQRIRFGANDPLLPQLRAAGHHMEPVERFDGTRDTGTQVVDFYRKVDKAVPVADEGWDTWKQLEALKFAQRHWSDQAVSVTVTYRREEIPKVQEWLRDNLHELKTISFLCHSDHGFKQAPKEAISAEQYERLAAKIRPLDDGAVAEGELLADVECAGGACPIR